MQGQTVHLQLRVRQESSSESEVPMSTAQLRACILFALGILFPSVSVADVVTDWNQSAGACVLEAKIYPFAGTRVMAIVHTAMFDAVNSIEGRYTPYKFKVSAPAGSSPEAAGVAAAHAALVQRIYALKFLCLDFERVLRRPIETTRRNIKGRPCGVGF